MSKTGDTLRFVAIQGIKISGEDVKAGQEIDLPFESAVELMSSGQLELATRQERPPYEAVAYAKGLFENRDVVGPVCTSPKTLERAAEQLLRDGRRNRLVNGHEVSWGYQALQSGIRMVLCGVVSYERTVFSQVSRPYQAVREKAAVICSDAEIEEQKILERGLVFLRDRYETTLDRRNRYEYAEVGPRWIDYGRALSELAEASTEFVQDCLQEGRVLVIDLFDNNAGLVSPTHWQQETYSPISYPNIHFVFTRDLPPQWFNEGKGPRTSEAMRNEKSAREWLEAKYSKGEPRLSKAGFVDMAMREFNLSQNRSVDVWKHAEIPNWKKPGRPRRSNN